MAKRKIYVPDAVDVHSKNWRRWIRWGRGEVAKIKKMDRRASRRVDKQDLKKTLTY